MLIHIIKVLICGSAVKKKHGGTEHEELYMSAVELIKLRVAQLEGSC